VLVSSASGNTKKFQVTVFRLHVKNSRYQVSAHSQALNSCRLPASLQCVPVRYYTQPNKTPIN
jgi:hypothetical protein